MGHRAALWLLLAGYSAWAFTAGLQNTPQEFGDSYRYLEYSILDVQNPGIVASAVLQGAGSPEGGLWAQVILSTIAWGLLASAVISALQYRMVGWALGVIVLAASLTAPVWSWNTLLASESTAVTSAVLWLASIVWISSRPSAIRLAFFSAASSVLIVTRPQVILVVGTVAVVVLAWFTRTNRRPALTAVAGLALIPALAWGVLRLMALGNEPKYRLYYAMNNLVDKSSFREHALARMPTCEPIEALLAGPQPWPDMFAFRAGPLMSSCPEAFVWLRGPNGSTANWLPATFPDALLEFLRALPAFLLPVYSQGRALPGPLPVAMSAGTWVWLAMVIGLVLGVILATVAGPRWHPTIASVAAVVAILSALVVNAWLIWAADGLEHDRHLLPLSVIVIMGALVLPSVLLCGRSESLESREPEAVTSSPTL